MDAEEREKFAWLEDLELAGDYEMKFLGVDKSELAALSSLPRHVYLSEREHPKLPKGMVSQAELVRSKALDLKRSASYRKQSGGDPQGIYRADMRSKALAVIAAAVRVVMELDREEAA